MKMDNKTAVIIVAGGSGKRMKTKEPKQFLSLLGKPVLFHSILPFQQSPKVREIILVVPPGDLEWCQKNIVSRFGLSKVTRIVAGGKERIDSVREGLNAVDPQTDYIAVHDGARPLIDCETIERVFDGALETGAAMLVQPMTDTVKKVDGSGNVIKTIPRHDLRLAQTPQIFRAEWLRKAYDLLPENLQATDDASVVEHAGYQIKTVCGEKINVKITTPADLTVAAFILSQRRKEHEDRDRI
ncbi:MAG: 2-C-methyl-D-erythritol 4-phosphate cytidylyltransferase [Tindallia sp. MSAO_Bac2]|nr:MAG: 2-C-methyl-D-erythritol 4-phosphate cytidylyltransferase [Tindallia sp. MSAO_Bac2]